MLLPKRHSLVCKHLKSELVIFSKTLNAAVNSGFPKASYSEVAENTATMRRGTGGRSSFSGVVATVFGATGFLGKYVVNQLGKVGSQVIIPYRGTTYSVRELRVMGDLGQILFQPLDIKDDESIRKAIKYSNVVINLIGKDTETSNYSHDAVHVDIAGRIARLSKEMGVEKFVHMSALNADVAVKPFIKKGGSSFLRTKAFGELEVRREFPEAIIFRPSDMYGHFDRFLIYYSRDERRLGLWRRSSIPLWRLGQKTIKQPVYGGDVARGLVKAVTDSSVKGVTIDAVGPHRYRLDHLVWWMHMIMGYKKTDTDIVDIDWLFKAKVRLFELIKPKYPIVSMERLERECITDDLSENLQTLEDLGIFLTPLEDRIYYELRYRKRNNAYWDSLDEVPVVPPPPKALF